ncbi:unnamed protein product [Arabidopsis halleri]
MFAAIFNVGWAATQVSHMAMVNSITLNSTSRVALTSSRNAFSMIGLDKGPLAGGIDYSDQLVVFRPQLELAKELNKPVAAVHCINAYRTEVVPKLAELGAYLSFSGWFTYIDEKIAKKTLKSVCFFNVLN